jgi:hypothetical protein
MIPLQNSRSKATYPKWIEKRNDKLADYHIARSKRCTYEYLEKLKGEFEVSILELLK